jgi:hypothetical protein
MAKWQDEFPDFDAATMPEIPAGWIDVSWHNDSAPSFNAGNGKIVSIDFADKDLREFAGGPRFVVMADPEIHDHNEPLFESDDWQAVLDFVGGN